MNSTPRINSGHISAFTYPKHINSANENNGKYKYIINNRIVDGANEFLIQRKHHTILEQIFTGLLHIFIFASYSRPSEYHHIGTAAQNPPFLGVASAPVTSHLNRVD